MFDLTKFTLSQMIPCGSELRALNKDARNMEEVANRTVRYLYEHFVTPQRDTSACALVRFYKTHVYGNLDPELAAFARSILGGDPESPTMKCLTLLATAGAHPEWNSREYSAGHKAIPLPSEEVIAKLPMIAQLVKQFGMEVRDVLEPARPLLVDLEQQAYNVFHVADAVGSPYIPAQEDFVIPYNVKSVVGFGGLLSSGDLFAVIMFATVSIPRETADLFKALSLNVKLAVQPFANGPTFA